MPLRVSTVVIAALVLGLVLTTISPATASQESEPSKDELEATIAAMQTQVAELDSQDTEATTSTPTSTGAWNAATTAGNGFEVLTPAPAGSVEVISTGIYDGQRLPFVIHNNTETAINDVSVEGAVLDESGGLFSVGGANTLNPGWIEVGAIGVGYLYFDGIEFPAGATVDMTVSFEVAESRGSLSSLEAAIDEWNQVDNRIVGFLTNPHSTEIIEPIAIDVVCLAEDGTVTSFNSDYAESASIPVDGRVPFQVALDSPSCEHILIVADGFNW